MYDVKYQCMLELKKSFFVFKRSFKML